MNQEAKNALDTIKTMLGASAYPSDADNLCIGVIENLMKRSVADYKRFLKDQQQNKKEYWVMVFNNGDDMSSSKVSEEAAIKFLTELQEESPGGFDEAYVTKVREVMDND